MAETSTLSSGLSSACVGLSCESSSDATSSSLGNVLERLKVPRLVFVFAMLHGLCFQLIKYMRK